MLYPDPAPLPWAQACSSRRGDLRGAVSPSLLLLASPTFCSLTPLQDTARQAFASPLFIPGGGGGGGQLSSPRAVLLLCSRHKPARQGPSPSPTPAFQRQVHLAGCLAPPAPHTPPRSQGGPGFNFGGQRLESPSSRHVSVVREGAQGAPPPTHPPGQGLTPSCCLGKWGDILGWGQTLDPILDWTERGHPGP